MKINLPNQTDYVQSPFKKNRKKMTCPVCGNSHRYHCSITEDGSLVLCKYKWSDRQAADGRYIHITSASNMMPAYNLTPPTIKEAAVERATAEVCDAVYTALLSHLKLTPAHGDALLNERGLSDTTIANNLYASVPDKARGLRLARALARFFDLKGVPGFYYRDAHWQINASSSGFYVPYRDERGRIVGLQVRRDTGEPRYLWFSSAGKPEGSSSGAPLHFAKPDLAERSGQVIITEGALKADRISEFSSAAVVALAGVTAMNHEKFASQLKQAFPQLQKVVMAFDMDWKIKPEVKSAMLRLQRTLRADGLEVEILVWDEALGKGFDDALYQDERRAA